MVTNKEILLYIIAPVVAVVLIDQIVKNAAYAQLEFWDFGMLHLRRQNNPGFMLGGFENLSKLYTVIVPSTIGAMLVFIYMVLQYFVPIRSAMFRVGLGIFLGGVLGNIVDRIRFGYVRDFLQVTLGNFSTAIFNIGDAVQWVGVVLFIVSYLASGSILYPIDERRGRKWIDPKFQGKYCFTLIFCGLSFALVSGVLSYTFLHYSILHSMNQTEEAIREFVVNFLMVYSATVLCFLITLFIVGVQMSHGIVGPIRGFENYLDGLLNGKMRQFKLRQNDDFRQLEILAGRFHEHFNNQLGLDSSPLQAGMIAPFFEAATVQNKTISISDYLGQKIWIIFYRYATCPLCAIHLDDIKEVIVEAQTAGMQVLLVYESKPEEFNEKKSGATVELLKSVNVPMISDPDRRIYSSFRTQRNSFKLFSTKIPITQFKAWRRNFKQTAIAGSLGQLPAHFIIDENGMIELAHYGTNMTDHVSVETIRDLVRGLPIKPPTT